jgi:hypothetical protein
VLAGIVAFYKDFVEALYENLRGQASVTGEHGSCIFLRVEWDIYVALCLLMISLACCPAVGHISHSQKVIYSLTDAFSKHILGPPLCFDSELIFLASALVLPMELTIAPFTTGC